MQTTIVQLVAALFILGHQCIPCGHKCSHQQTCMFKLCLCLQPLLHEAVAAPGNSANPPFPPSLKRLMEVADMTPTGRDEQMLVAHSNLTVARYFLHHAAVPPVGTSLIAMRLGVRLHCVCCTPAPFPSSLLGASRAGRLRPIQISPALPLIVRLSTSWHSCLASPLYPQKSVLSLLLQPC